MIYEISANIKISFCLPEFPLSVTPDHRYSISDDEIITVRIPEKISTYVKVYMTVNASSEKDALTKFYEKIGYGWNATIKTDAEIEIKPEISIDSVQVESEEDTEDIVII